MRKDKDVLHFTGETSFSSSFFFLHFRDFRLNTSLVKDQSSFYEICSLATGINIKGFHRVNRKQLKILKTFLLSGILYCCLLSDLKVA